MGLRHPGVQRDNPRQQAKTDHAEQPEAAAQRVQAQHAEIEGLVALPQQPAEQRQQQRAETPEGEPEFARGAASGEEHRAECHDLRHHH